MRSPSRNQNPPWMRPITERLSPTITALVVANTLILVLYIMVAPTRMFIQEHLALGPAAFAGGEPWQVLTSLFVHLEPVSYFFNILGLWFVGVAIERQLGRRRFLAIFFGSALLGNVVMATLMLVLGHAELHAGSSLGTLALFVAFGRIFDRTPARIFGSLVMQARTLTFLLVGFALAADLLRGSMVALGGDIVALLAAYLLSGGRGAGMMELWSRVAGGGGKPRRKFHVVEGGRRTRAEERPRYLN